MVLFIGAGLPAFADLGISLSNTCLTMLKNNVSSNCPTYEEILTLYPDTSNRMISGDFDYSEGILQRQNSKYNDHFQFYRYDNVPTRWIDPPADVIEKIPMIRITSSDFTYKIPSQVITNNTLLIGQSRYISNNCDEAIITADNWLFLLGDTVQYMDHKCDPAFTNFDEIKIKTWEKTKHDITTSYKYKLDTWIKESLKKCKNKCFTY
jgi:hypothetical protein